MPGNVLSKQGPDAEAVPMHRALARLRFPRRRLLTLALFPAAFTLGLWLMRHPILALWQALLAFWSEKLAPGTLVSLGAVGPAALELRLPAPVLHATAPDGLTWGLTLGTTVLILSLARTLPEHLLPLRYFLRVAGFIQLTSLAFFAIVPEAFPYSLPEYLRSLLEAGLCLLVLLPWMHAAVYYVFDFSWWRKVALTALTLSFLIVAIPLLVMLHAGLLRGGSLLQLPLVYLLFGVWPWIFACIALYGWAMSWPHPPAELAVRRAGEEEAASFPPA